LSHGMMKSRERRLSLVAERNMCSVAMRDTVVPPGSKSTSRANGSRWNLGDLVSGRRCLRRRSASGRRGAVADDERAREVGLRHSSWEADEQSGVICCGVGGAKGGDQGECGPAKHATDSEPHKRVTGAGPHTAKSLPLIPEVGAVCGKAASTDLCGGRSVMSVPTATASRKLVRSSRC
jgi:hypothetical protein